MSCIRLCFGLSEAMSTMLDILFFSSKPLDFVHISLPIYIHVQSADGHTYPMIGHVLYITLFFLCSSLLIFSILQTIAYLENQ